MSFKFSCLCVAKYVKCKGIKEELVVIPLGVTYFLAASRIKSWIKAEFNNLHIIVSSSVCIHKAELVKWKTIHNMHFINMNVIKGLSCFYFSIEIFFFLNSLIKIYFVLLFLIKGTKENIITSRKFPFFSCNKKRNNSSLYNPKANSESIKNIRVLMSVYS